MGAEPPVLVTLDQEEGCAFRIRFDDDALEPLSSDEASPLGGGRPHPSRLLLAAIANCLSTSLLSASRK